MLRKAYTMELPRGFSYLSKTQYDNSNVQKITKQSHLIFPAPSLCSKNIRGHILSIVISGRLGGAHQLPIDTNFLATNR